MDNFEVYIKPQPPAPFCENNMQMSGSVVMVHDRHDYGSPYDERDRLVTSRWQFGTIDTFQSGKPYPPPSLAGESI